MGKLYHSIPAWWGGEETCSPSRQSRGTSRLPSNPAPRAACRWLEQQPEGCCPLARPQRRRAGTRWTGSGPWPAAVCSTVVRESTRATVRLLEAPRCYKTSLMHHTKGNGTHGATKWHVCTFGIIRTSAGGCESSEPVPAFVPSKVLFPLGNDALSS